MEHHDQAQTTVPELSEPARGAENFLRWTTSAMLRGGRVTKFKRVAASYSPELGLVTPGFGRGLVAGGGQTTSTLGLARRLLRWSAAPIALLAAGSPALAQDACVEVNPNEFVCEDNGDPATDIQELGGFDAIPLTVEIEDGFDIDTSGTGTRGLVVINAEGITINLADGATSTIIGDTDGVRLDNEDDGGINAVLGNVTGVTGDGVSVLNTSSNGDGVSLDTTVGVVSGGQDGIEVRNSYGAVSVTTADVTGSDRGIVVGSNGDGVVIDSTAGAVSAGGNGIDALNTGTGSISITTSDVVSSANLGIFVQNGSGNYQQTDVQIDTTAGSIAGASGGIFMSQLGSGETSITTADIESSNGSGIFATNLSSSAGLVIDTSAGSVYANTSGISVISFGTGALEVTTAGVVGQTADGINVFQNGDGGIVIDTTADGEVRGGEDGIDAINNGAGDTIITTGDVTGETGQGINVNNGFDTGDVTIDSRGGEVAGGDNGIRLRNYGDGNAVILTGNVTGATGDGIYARDDGELGNGVDLSIDSTAGTVSGAEDGIDAFNFDSGDMSIVTADVDGASGDGINAYNQSAASDVGFLTIDSSAGSVSGGQDGIEVRNNGGEDVSITTANVTGTNGDGINVRLLNTDGDLFLDTSAGAVTGGTNGIFTRSYGDGTVSITTAGVTGLGADGINVAQDGNDGVFIDTTADGEVRGREDGIDVGNYGAGDVSITTGDVVGETGYGINVYNGEGSGGVAIDTTAGAVVAGVYSYSDAIRVDNQGRGSSIVYTADVISGDGSGEGGDAISVVNGANAEDLTIDTSAGDVTGDKRGIFANNQGTGDTTVTAANVTGTGGDGIRVDNGYGSGAIRVDSSAGAVVGSANGIYTYSRRFYAPTTVITGDVTGQNGAGIFVQEYGEEGYGPGAITINSAAGTVTGATDGINANNRGFGSLSITTGSVTGESRDGIAARNNEVTTGRLTIDSSAGAVAGGSAGITATNDGSGVTSITTADVSGGEYGIYARNGTYSGDLTIDSSAGAVESDVFGIATRNYGTGDTRITTGEVNGSTGVFALNVASTGDLTIDSSAGSVAGVDNGIFAVNNGSGSTSITTAGVTADGIGIDAENDGTDLIINSVAGSVSGGEGGIVANNGGTGASSITTANVSSENDDGINFLTGADTTTLNIDTTAGAIMGDRGIVANHGGSDDLTITVGNVTGQGAEGILASTTQIGADIFVSGGGGVDSNVIGATHGIRLQTQGANITVTGLDSVTGQNGDGLNVTSNGGDIFVSDIGTIAGLGGNGIFATSDAGNITIDNVGFEGGITATDGIGIAAYADNGGTITIGTSGPVSGTTYGIDGAVNGTGDVIINTTNYEVAAAIGIRAVNAGDGNVSVTTAGVTGTAGEGIHASAAAGSVTVDSSAGAVTGLTDGIVTISSGTGSTTITTADVTGTTGDGIAAYGDAGSGNLSIDSTTGAVTGGRRGIYAYSVNSGGVTITAANVTGNADYGINVTTFNADDITVDTTQGTVTGATGGIFVEADDSGSDITITTADVVGETENGIRIQNFSGGDVSIDSAAGAVSGERSGISVLNNGLGDTSIVTGDVTALAAAPNRFNGVGIDVTNDVNSYRLMIDSTAGTVQATSYGIRAIQYGRDDVVITTGDVTAGSNDGILVTDGFEGADGEGSITIDTVAGTVTAARRGIVAFNVGEGSLSITTANVTGTTGAGIYAVSSGSTLEIDTSGGLVTGGTHGIVARNIGIGDLSIVTGSIDGGTYSAVDAENSGDSLTVDSTGGALASAGDTLRAINDGAGDLSILTMDVTSGDRTAVLARNAGDNLSVDSTLGTVSGEINGLLAINEGEGELDVATADTNGNASVGILAMNYGTALTIETTDGAVSGGAIGIVAENFGNGDLAITTGDVIGAGLDGIRAVNTGGAVSIDTSEGTVMGAATGITVDQQSTSDLALFVNEVMGGTGIDSDATTGGTLITLSSTALVVGTQGFAIDARSMGGAITIEGSSGTVSGATDGIYVRSSGGDIGIDDIDLVQGVSGDGLDLGSAGGSISILALDTIIGAAGNGILADAGGGDIDIAGNGDIMGSASGIAARTAGDGVIAIDLAGATYGQAYGVEVSTEGGAVTIGNSGTLSGGTFAVFAGDDDTGPINLVNDGAVGTAISFAGGDDTFDNRGMFDAEGASDFGNGGDQFLNVDTILVANSAEFLNLEQFTSGGLITLLDGETGGSLSTSGDFAGNGGVLALDVDFANGTSDVFVIGGAATGQTELVLNLLNTDATLANDILLIDAGAGTTADAFAISAEQQQISPFLSFQLDFDAATNDFLFGLALEPRVFEAGKLAEGAHALWYRSADAWSDHRANARFAKEEAAPVWAVLYGAEADRDEAFADPTGVAIGDAVLDYSQDFFGIQGGAEKRIGENLTLGVTGGYISSRLRLEQSSTRTDFEAFNIGASISFAKGGLFVEALAKYDDISGDVRDAAIGGFNGELDGTAFGGRIELGYRTKGTAFYVEPRLGIEYQQTGLDDLDIAGQNFQFDGFDGLRGSAGVRLGGNSALGQKSTIGYYLDASAVHEFEGDGTTRFTFATDEAVFNNDPVHTHAHFEAGVTIDTDGPLSGFFQVEGDLSKDYSSFGGKAGVRLRF